MGNSPENKGGNEVDEYNFDMKVTGYCRVSVKAGSYEEAREAMSGKMAVMDFGILEDACWEINDAD